MRHNRYTKQEMERLKEAPRTLGAEDEVWTGGTCLALASQSCTYCFGLGKRAGRQGRKTTCHCVLRAVFRVCHARFAMASRYGERLAHSPIFSHAAGVHASRRSGRHRMYGLPNEEYMADFCLIARRALNEHRYRVFKYHFLLGADCNACIRKLQIDRGAFFHEVYRVQEQLGKAFAETKPYALFPIDEYFASSAGGSKAKTLPAAASGNQGCEPKACAAAVKAAA